MPCVSRIALRNPHGRHPSHLFGSPFFQGPSKSSILASFLPGFLQLVQEGRFQEACLGTSSLAQAGQDCGPQGMQQFIQQALGDTGHSWGLGLKLQSAVAATEWM